MHNNAMILASLPSTLDLPDSLLSYACLHLICMSALCTDPTFWARCEMQIAVTHSHLHVNHDLLLAVSGMSGPTR